MFIPPGNPALLDEQFVDEYPLLAMRATSGSGSYWGDGDGRPKSIRYDELQFAMEGKVRISGHTHSRPRPVEWVKALTQLRKRNRSAIRLFVVHDCNTQEFTVSIPEDDVEQLRGYDLTVDGIKHTFTRKGETYNYLLLDEMDWDELYDELEQRLAI